MTERERYFLASSKKGWCLIDWLNTINKDFTHLPIDDTSIYDSLIYSGSQELSSWNVQAPNGKITYKDRKGNTHTFTNCNWIGSLHKWITEIKCNGYSLAECNNEFFLEIPKFVNVIRTAAVELARAVYIVITPEGRIIIWDLGNCPRLTIQSKQRQSMEGGYSTDQISEPLIHLNYHDKIAEYFLPNYDQKRVDERVKLRMYQQTGDKEFLTLELSKRNFKKGASN